MPGEAAEIALMTDNMRPADSGSTPLAQLIARARAGEAEAFDELVLCHQRRVAATAWRLLGSREEARDAAQEVFLRVYRHLGKYDPRQDFSGWLYRITVNVCRDLRRKRGRPGQTASLDAEPDRPAPDDTEAGAIRAQQQAILARALATLSEKERAAIVLRDLEGLPTEEVARLLGSTQGTVRSQVCSARAKIKLYRDRLLGRAR